MGTETTSMDSGMSPWMKWLISDNKIPSEYHLNIIYKFTCSFLPFTQESNMRLQFSKAWLHFTSVVNH
eukprot:662420-Ditylum_brightwellii.AAC.1